MKTGVINTIYIDRFLENRKNLWIFKVKIYKREKKNTYVKKWCQYIDIRDINILLFLYLLCRQITKARLKQIHKAVM